MKSVVVVLACVLVAASAQQFNRYQPYNQYNQYNKYNQYNRYQSQYQNQNQYSPYKSPYATRAPFPFPSIVVSTTAKPVVVPAEPIASVVVPLPAIVPAKAPAVVLSQVAPVARVASDDRSAETVKYGNEITDDGRNYFFETNNGIAVQAQLIPRNYGGNPPVIADVAQGSFSWTSPEGKLIAISYTADENGYQATGDALPQAPEVPAQIARALAYGARFSAGIKN